MCPTGRPQHYACKCCGYPAFPENHPPGDGRASLGTSGTLMPATHLSLERKLAVHSSGKHR